MHTSLLHGGHDNLLVVLRVAEAYRSTSQFCCRRSDLLVALQVAGMFQCIPILLHGGHDDLLSFFRVAEAYRSKYQCCYGAMTNSLSFCRVAEACTSAAHSLARGL